MKNFDDELRQDMAFQIGGESFQMRLVRPEVLASWDDVAADDPNKALEFLDERIKVFLDPSDNDAWARWDALRQRDVDPVSMGHLNALLLWMVEVQAGRPTEQPSASGRGRGKTAATSTVVSV